MSMHILAFTSSRIDEIEEPLSIHPNNYTLVDGCELGALWFMWESIKTSTSLRKKENVVLLIDDYGIVAVTAIIIHLIFQYPIVTRFKGDPWKEFNEERKIKRKFFLKINLILIRILSFYSIGFIAISNNIKSTIFSRLNCDPNRILYVPLSIPPQFKSSGLSKRGSSCFRKDKITFLTVTNLNYRLKYKGIKYLLSEISHILSENAVNLVILGGGCYLQPLQNYIANNLSESQKESVTIEGFVDDPLPYYRNSDVFVYISYLDAYPRVTVEAGASGLPLVVNDQFGLKEQVINGYNGFKINTNNEGELSKKLEQLKDSKLTRIRMGNAAKIYANSMNNKDIIGQKLYDGINELL